MITETSYYVYVFCLYGDEQIDLYVYKCLPSNIVAFLIALQCSGLRIHI